ncbi:AMP-binding protein [Nonomuraea sp. N2-4H]|jgi:fatty-acyl-CoA synthase
MSVLSYEPLTPTSFLQRSAAVFGHRLAVVDGDLELTYAELWQRVQRLAGGLAESGIGPGDRVACWRSTATCCWSPRSASPPRAPSWCR